MLKGKKSAQNHTLLSKILFGNEKKKPVTEFVKITGRLIG